MATKFAFAQGLKELRFHLCQTSEHSAAARQFLLRTYPTMKKHNPETPIMIREALDVTPKVWARYGRFLAQAWREEITANRWAEFGKEKMVPLNGMDDKAIETKVTELVQSTMS
ncbi:hypothetical protein BLS_000603 [Venturia inaequalis]|uniref:Ribosomal protein/NADH dehydrogenase domain-containing protein n=1 Tax=Venturia inaequalis TaxID=5025 RepID=A0A8H3VIA4_VENIN|nr:hypothetical protein EG328_004030 [Venturia inaequalis]KAE9978479.1 hypothetical protein BLS_000603 [Venturia inaequalis]KAE9989624.1 hypothetical protein EG327_002460 [Venturia inaequalis]